MSAATSMLFVHAHPDDESIGTGLTMAHYAALGARVTLVTCTRGESGDVMPPELRYLEADGDALGSHRATELHAACAELGVTDQRFLGGAGRWRDSGMPGTPPNDDPRAFWRAGVEEAGACLAEVVREVRADVVVTYDEDGGYGHPDHVQAHRVSRWAFEHAATTSAPDSWRPRRFYAIATPLSLLRDSVGRGPFPTPDSVEAYGFGTPDERITSRVADDKAYAAKLRALRAHRSQLALDGDWFALTDGVGQPLGGPVEHFVRLAGEPGSGPDGLEAGLTG
ncbi:N-acetyl-1-D-myo-inositol-2-amino-2-deoxy-alpha-D-glucopyranoside deacetylase [Streptomyces sp. cg35]|uniref:N-acetyl-1-D-myo-inositol-2-amino-2-deoxy-alpha- D-glucopyranoside deacetylase n=1 Tax=Streptomyces sp. cg35 TaxID=3421650 RepID=UPI003D181589